MELPLRSPRTIILGSSRIHDGVDPENPILQEYAPVYNLGIDMLRIHEALEYVRHAIKNSSIKRIVFGLDFFMFNAAEDVNPSFDSALVGRKIRLIDYVYLPLFSKDALFDSLRTLKVSRRQAERREFLRNGYRPGAFVFYRLKDYRKLHYYTNWIFLSPRFNGTYYYGYHRLGERTFSDLEEILVLCREKKIDLRLFITPAHANLDGETIFVTGLWDRLQDWKRRLVDISTRYQVPLWDFSGYNSITTEPVRSPMEYYWDSSHFKPNVSDEILKRMFANSADNSAFGIKLTRQTVDRHLRETEAARSAYVLSHREEVEELREMYQSILAGQSLRDEKVRGIY